MTPVIILAQIHALPADCYVFGLGFAVEDRRSADEKKDSEDQPLISDSRLFENRYNSEKEYYYYYGVRSNMNNNYKEVFKVKVDPANGDHSFTTHICSEEDEELLPAAIPLGRFELKFSSVWTASPSGKYFYVPFVKTVEGEGQSEGDARDYQMKMDRIVLNNNNNNNSNDVNMQVNMTTLDVFGFEFNESQDGRILNLKLCLLDDYSGILTILTEKTVPSPWPNEPFINERELKTTCVYEMRLDNLSGVVILQRLKIPQLPTKFDDDLNMISGANNDQCVYRLDQQICANRFIFSAQNLEAEAIKDYAVNQQKNNGQKLNWTSSQQDLMFVVLFNMDMQNQLYVLNWRLMQWESFELDESVKANGRVKLETFGESKWNKCYEQGFILHVSSSPNEKLEICWINKRYWFVPLLFNSSIDSQPNWDGRLFAIKHKNCFEFLLLRPDFPPQLSNFCFWILWKILFSRTREFSNKEERKRNYFAIFMKLFCRKSDRQEIDETAYRQEEEGIADSSRPIWQKCSRWKIDKNKLVAYEQNCNDMNNIKIVVAPTTREMAQLFSTIKSMKQIASPI